MHWLKISFILCMFGCFKDFRPSESFVTHYLTGPWKNFTDIEVNRDVYPVGTYGNAATLVVVFLITDFLRYKPIIIICGLIGIVTFVLIVVGKTLLLMQIMEVCYSMILSTEVAYYTYIYAKVDKKHYQEVTGHTKAACLVGRSMSGVVAQLTTSFEWLDYEQLNYITISSFCIATIWSFFLPSVGQSIYFHRVNSDEESRTAVQRSEKIDRLDQRSSLRLCCNGRKHSRKSSGDEVLEDKTRRSRNLCCSCVVRSYDNENGATRNQFRKIIRAYALLWQHFVQAYTNYSVLKWSFWWAFGTCGYLQVVNYSQMLWKDTTKPVKLYNGAVDFMYAILGALTVFYVGKLRLNWPLLGDISLCVFSLLEGLILLACTYSYNLWLLYAGYIVFGVIYHTMVTVVSFEVAKYISEDSYGLIFGINIFVALVLQSLLTYLIIDVFNLEIREQYLACSIFFLALAVIYVLASIINIVQYYRSGQRFRIWLSDDNSSSTAQIRDDVNNVVSSQFENKSS